MKRWAIIILLCLHVKSTFSSILSSASETWVLNKKYKSKIQTMEMRLLRKVAGKTRRDKIRNETIRRKLGVPPLRIKIGHVLRTGEERIVRKAQGRRPVGRPRQTWEEQVSIVMVGRGINWREARIVAQDRSRWRRLCRYRKVEEDDD
jgi:hypothetical protein